MLDRILHIEQESYQALVESIRDYAIIMLDPNGFVSSWNKGAGQVHGFEEQEIIGRHFSSFYASEDKAKGLPDLHLQKVIELGQYEDEGWRVRSGRKEY